MVLKIMVAFVEFKLLSASATVPTRAHAGDAGYDLYSPVDHVIPPGSHSLIPTDLSVKLPAPTYEGLSVYGRIAPRSGMSLKKATDVGGGVVDLGFDGNIGVILFNHGKEHLKISRGDKIAQFILEVCMTPRIRVDYGYGNPAVEVIEDESRERGSHGFGSSGV